MSKSSRVSWFPRVSSADALVVLFCLAFSAPTLYAGPKEDADRLYQRALFTDDMAALSLLNKALNADPDHLPARFRLGWIYQKMNRQDEAIRAYESVLRIQSCHAKALNNMGNAYLEKGEKAQAAEDYRRALQCDPKMFLALYNLGNLAYEGGDVARAEDLFRRALAIEPRHARALHNLAVVLTDERRKPGAAGAEALTLVDRALAIESSNPLFHYTRARIFLLLGRRDDAKTELGRAERLTKGDTSLLTKIRRLLAEINQTL
ncbi:MAG: tetratricopeptide repeat protein [Spirochaetia bacterium]|nr:tetratricopeptide repeat protein [Spirochaetia bacterium]